MLEEHDRVILLTEVRHAVQKNGYAVLHQRGTLRYAATSGCFQSFGMADAIVCGLDATEGSALLHRYVAACRAGEHYVYGETYRDDVLGRFLQMHPVTQQYRDAFHLWEVFGIEATPWVQIVWSALAGEWPWSRQAEADCRFQQCFTAHGHDWGRSRPA